MQCIFILNGYIYITEPDMRHVAPGHLRVCTHIIVIWHGYFKTDIVPPGKKPRILTTRPNGVTMMGRVNLNILYKYKNGGYPRGVGYVHVYYSYIRKHVT